jgi:hypothetical protein
MTNNVFRRLPGGGFFCDQTQTGGDDMNRARPTMLHMRRELIEQDRRRAMAELIRFIHYNIEPEIPPRDPQVETQPVTLFGSPEELESFRREQCIQASALEWVFQDMEYSHSLERRGGKVVLLKNGINEYCRD